MTVPDAPQPPRRHKDGWAQTPGDVWQRSGGRAGEPAPHERSLRAAGGDGSQRPAAPPQASWTPHEEWLPDPRPAPDHAWSPDTEWDRFARGVAARSGCPGSGMRARVAAWVSAVVDELRALLARR
ncbi:hypothetical protein FBY24_1176 [Cellulomonas sp. SLBN-39]|nr:hypothetical protein FBY24_1176 [Cellulomonas sp. SLBN-39]